MLDSHFPKLRFESVTVKSLETKPLLHFCSRISDGIHSTPVYDSEGDYYFINGNNLVDGRVLINSKTKKVNRSEYEKHKRQIDSNTILMSINGTIGSLASYDDEAVVLGKSACYINVRKEYNKLYIFYSLQIERINKYFLGELTGTTIKNLSLTTIKKVKVNVPCIKEQKKIAAFLSAVDKKICILKDKHYLLVQYKKGMMQKLFSQGNRFKDESGNDFPDWSKGTLGDLSIKVSKKNKDESVTTVLTNSAKSGIVNQTDYFKKDIANENNLGGYSIVEKDYFVYNPRISTLAPVGPIKRNHVGLGIMSPLYTVFRFKDDNILDYLELYFESSQWHRYMNSIANIGARHDRMNIIMGDFFNLPISIPSQNEMKKIVGFIQALSKKVNVVGQQIEQTQTFKKGLLQQMFV